VDYFEVDKHVVIAELKALRCTNFDVDSYVAEFNKSLARYPMNGSDELYLKDIFVASLPFKL
jgi:hypothetical protein